MNVRIYTRIQHTCRYVRDWKHIKLRVYVYNHHEKANCYIRIHIYNVTWIGCSSALMVISCEAHACCHILRNRLSRFSCVS